MNKSMFCIMLLALSGSALAGPPSEDMVRSCLMDRGTATGVSVLDLDTSSISEQDDYANGFNATYFFQYQNEDIGYAEKGNIKALIFKGKLYKLSSASPLGDNHGSSNPGEFSPTLADWSFVKQSDGRYLCVSFNFDGLGQSGSFQKVHGGYLLDIQTKTLYYAVRYLP
jgi:hypothetical protein